MRVWGPLLLVACGNAPTPSPGILPPDASVTCAANDESPLGDCYPHEGIGDESGDVIARSQPSNDAADFIAGSNTSGANVSGVAWATELSPKGVVFLELLDDGAQNGTGATLQDLQAWAATHDDVTYVDQHRERV